MTASEVEAWHREALEPDRLDYVAQRRRTYDRNREVEAFAASLDRKHLSSLQVRQDMAVLVNTVLTAEMTTMPLVDVDAGPAQTKAHAAARHYLEQVAERVKTDVEHLDGSTRKRFLRNVSLDTLLGEEVFAQHMSPRHPEYLFVRDLKRLRERPASARVVAPRVATDWTDPTLGWLADGDVVRQRVKELCERSEQLALDHAQRFGPRDASHQLLDGHKLRLEGELVVAMLNDRTVDGAYFALGLDDERRASREVNAAVEDVRLELLHELDDLPEAGFRAQIESLRKHHYSAPRPARYEKVVACIGPLMTNEAAHRLCEDLAAWHAVYTQIAASVRRQWPSVDEGLERLDKTWAVMLADAAKERVASAPTLAEFRQRHADCHSVATSDSAQRAVECLLENVEAAMRPPSSIAALTKSYSWREQVRGLIGAGWSSSLVNDWFEMEHVAVAAVEEALRPVEAKWRARAQELADSCARVSEVMSEKHRAWMVVGRLELARDLFDRQVSLMPRAPFDDRIQWDTWARLRDSWPDELGPWWRPDEVATYTPRGARLITWRDVQMCVLMRTWERCSSIS